MPSIQQIESLPDGVIKTASALLHERMARRHLDAGVHSGKPTCHCG
jgi:hypothetical protein